MFQGPMGLVPMTGRACTMFSYYPRSATVHNQVMPETLPAAPLVSYIPAEADLPTTTGYPPIRSGTETYGELWMNITMMTFKNLNSSIKRLYFSYRTADESYANIEINLPANSHVSYVSGRGLYNPGIGLSEDYKMYCVDGNGLVTLSKSWFVVVPMSVVRGTMKYFYDLQVITGSESIFNQTKSGVGQIGVRIGNSSTMYITTDNVILPCAMLSSNSQHVVNLVRPMGEIYSHSDMDKVMHFQFRYPIAVLYNMSMR